jgi:hypothetical protein
MLACAHFLFFFLDDNDTSGCSILLQCESSSILAHVIARRDDQQDTTKGEIIRVAEQLAHPENEFAMFVYDFHLLRLERPSESSLVEFNFLQHKPQQANDELVAIGFGDTTAPRGVGSDRMNYVTLLCLPNQQCQKLGGGAGIT